MAMPMPAAMPRLATVVMLFEVLGFAVEPLSTYLEATDKHPALRLRVANLPVQDPPPGHVLVNELLRHINHSDIMWYAESAAFLDFADMLSSLR